MSFSVRCRVITMLWMICSCEQWMNWSAETQFFSGFRTPHIFRLAQSHAQHRAGVYRLGGHTATTQTAITKSLLLTGD